MALAFLGLASGFCSAWLGAGVSVLIVPLLPLLSGLDPLSSLQVSLFVIFSISLINSLSFIFQKLVLWPLFFRSLSGALLFAFLSGFFVSSLSPFQIRLALWLFLALILSLPWLLKAVPAALGRPGLYFFSALMGLCSGFTGLGGGMILSPYLHESQKIPVKNIPAAVSCIMFFVSSFSILGQASRPGFSFGGSSLWLFCFFLLLIPSVLGLIFGYFANIRQKSARLRRLFLRLIVALMFCQLTWELADPLKSL